MALVASFAPSLRSGANDATRATNKQYALQGLVIVLFSYPELRSSWPAPRIESSGQRSNTCACPWFSTSGLFPVQRCSARSINFNWCYGTSVNEIYHYLNDLDRILPRINEDPCGSKHKRGDPVWVKLVAYYTFIVVRWVINKLQMHFPVNSFSVSSAQRTSYVLFCFIWFWDGRVAFRCGLTITLAWYLRQFEVDRQQLKPHFVENFITCGEIKKFYEKETNVKLFFKLLSNWSTNTHDFTVFSNEPGQNMFCKGKNIITESKYSKFK